MTKKQILFIMIALIVANSFIFAEESHQKGFAFNDANTIGANGNQIRKYLRWRSHQEKMKQVKIIKCDEDGNLRHIGNVGSFRKTASEEDADEFVKQVSMNNVIGCEDVEEVVGYDGNVYLVGAIVYPTRDLKYCPLVREFVALQKLAAEKNAVETNVENVTGQK